MNEASPVGNKGVECKEQERVVSVPGVGNTRKEFQFDKARLLISARSYPKRWFERQSSNLVKSSSKRRC